MISFWLPAEIQLVNRDKCEIQLEGIKPITLQLKATCPETGATEGLKVIIPDIFYRHSRCFWNNQPDFPTIWVRRRLGRVVFLKSVNLMGNAYNLYLVGSSLTTVTIPSKLLNANS